MDNIKEEIIGFEHAMWDAVLKNDIPAFKQIVTDNAIMICGGMRCLGSEYAAFVADFKIEKYSMINAETIFIRTDLVQIHYIVDIEVNDSQSADLSGQFHVVSLWEKSEQGWHLVFNMDSRIIPTK